MTSLEAPPKPGAPNASGLAALPADAPSDLSLAAACCTPVARRCPTHSNRWVISSRRAISDLPRRLPSRQGLAQRPRSGLALAGWVVGVAAPVALDARRSPGDPLLISERGPGF